MKIEISILYDTTLIVGHLSDENVDYWSFKSNDPFFKKHFLNGLITFETFRDLYDKDGNLVCEISEGIFNSAYSAAKLFLEEMPKAIKDSDYKMVMTLLPHLNSENATPNIEYICAPVREDLRRKYFQNYFIDNIGVYKPSYEELTIFEVRKDTEDLGTADDPDYVVKHLYPGLTLTNY